MQPNNGTHPTADATILIYFLKARGGG